MKIQSEEDAVKALVELHKLGPEVCDLRFGWDEILMLFFLS